MIPDDAVEAAAFIVYRTSGRKRVMSYEQARPMCEDDARAILEAAAPHLMAPVLALADKWQADFPDKARQLREAIGDNS